MFTHGQKSLMHKDAVEIYSLITSLYLFMVYINELPVALPFPEETGKKPEIA